MLGRSGQCLSCHVQHTSFLYSRRSFPGHTSHSRNKERHGATQRRFHESRRICAKVGLGLKRFATSWLTSENISLELHGPCALRDQGSQPDQYGRGPAAAGTLFECLQIGIWNDHHESSEFHRHKDDTIYCLLLAQSPESHSYQRVGIGYLRIDSGDVRLNTPIRWELKEVTIE